MATRLRWLKLPVGVFQLKNSDRLSVPVHVKPPSLEPLTYHVAAPPAACRDEFGEPLKSLRFFAAKGETIGFIVAAKTADVRVNLPGVSAKLFAMNHRYKLSEQSMPIMHF